jgi:hypothetical protein
MPKEHAFPAAAFAASALMFTGSQPPIPTDLPVPISLYVVAA